MCNTLHSPHRNKCINWLSYRMPKKCGQLYIQHASARSVYIHSVKVVIVMILTFINFLQGSQVIIQISLQGFTKIEKGEIIHKYLLVWTVIRRVREFFFTLSRDSTSAKQPATGAAKTSLAFQKRMSCVTVCVAFQRTPTVGHKCQAYL